MLLRAAVVAAFVAVCHVASAQDGEPPGEVVIEDAFSVAEGSSGPLTYTPDVFWSDCGGVDNIQECADTFMEACREDPEMTDPGCVGAMCGKPPPGCVTGTECECFLHHCYSFDQPTMSPTLESDMTTTTTQATTTTTTTTATTTPPGEGVVSTATTYTKPKVTTAVTAGPGETLPYMGGTTATTATTTPPGEVIATTTVAATTTTTTVATTTTPPTVPEPFCACSDKTQYMDIVDDGKVHAGGWLYLTNTSFYNCTKIKASKCSVTGSKVTFGMSAMFREGIPHGHTSFGIEGKDFHFLSEQGNTPYKYLDIKRDGINAQWMGKGSISTYDCACGRIWLHGFCFMVTVKDLGEPGHVDTSRMRVWDCTGVTGNPNCNAPSPLSDEQFAQFGHKEECLVFDTNYVPKIDTRSTEYEESFPLPNTHLQNDTNARFNGTEVGELGITHGGGNIQVQLYNKTNGFLEWMNSNGYTCTVCPVNQTLLDISDVGYVSGTGYIRLGHTSYLKFVDDCFNMTGTTYDGYDDKREGGYLFQAAEIARPNPEICTSQLISGLRGNYKFDAWQVSGETLGSFSFSMQGFHIKSNYAYDCLEIVCDDTYGGAMKAGPARITGVGKVSFSTRTTPLASEWIINGGEYRFWAVVVDSGEPAYLDTFRLRVEDSQLPGSILFDTNYNSGPIFQSKDIESCTKHDQHALYTLSVRTDVDTGDDIFTEGYLPLMDPICKVDSQLCESDPDFTGISLVQVFNGTQEGLNAILARGESIELHCKNTSPVAPTR